MIIQRRLGNLLAALSGAVLIALLSPGAAQAGHRHGWDEYRTVVVHRHIVHRPVVTRVVVIERPYRAHLHRSHRWHRHVHPRWPARRWHDRPRCWLPERYLCR